MLEDRAAIERLLVEYAYRLDAGEFERFAELFADGVWLGHSGYDAVLEWVRGNLYLYGDIPLTQHVVSNVAIDVDGDTARATSYLTVAQRSPDAERFDVITTVRYEDEFARRDGGWVFRDRRPTRRLIGDNSRHRRSVADSELRDTALIRPAETVESAVAGLSLADRIELRELVGRYAVAADARDGDAVADLFAPNGVLMIFDCPDPDARPLEVRDTPEALAAGPKRLDRYVSTSHFVGQQVLRSTAAGVSGITYCDANHLYDDGGQRMNFVVHVRYLDDYCRVAGAWRFAVRRVVFDFVEHRPVGGAIL